MCIRDRLSTSQNKERICDLFNPNGGAKNAMRLTVMSFGFKFGVPPEADLVLDVRCLPNPFYVPEPVSYTHLILTFYMTLHRISPVVSLIMSIRVECKIGNRRNVKAM